MFLLIAEDAGFAEFQRKQNQLKAKTDNQIFLP